MPGGSWREVTEIRAECHHMAARPAPTRLRIGDIVSVQIACFGQEYAQGKAGERWRHPDERDKGTITGKDGDRWFVDFEDGEEVRAWKRSALRFESRAPNAAGTSRSNPLSRQDDEDSSDEEGESPDAGGTHAENDADDSSSSDDDEVEVPAAILSEHGEGLGPPGAASTGQWVQDDTYGVDERARHGFTSKPAPVLELRDWEHASLFRLGTHFLPMGFLDEMAAAMTRTAEQKFRDGSRRFQNFTVAKSDLLQWIGVWMYMLAFNQSGGHRGYFGSQSFGPDHCLERIMACTSNNAATGKTKGVDWFESMLACFTLPTFYGVEHEQDPFRPTRKCVHTAHLSCTCFVAAALLT